MRRWLGSALFAIATLAAVPAALASPCTRAELDKADYLAQPLIRQTIAKNGNGNDIRSRITNCDFNTYSRQFKIQVALDWRGAVNRSNSYWLNGEMTFDDTGRGGRFAEIAASQTLKDHRTRMMIAGVTILMLDGAAKAQKAPSPPPSPATDPLNRIAVDNRCRHDAIVNIAWLDTGSNWRTGQWALKPGQRGNLSTGGKNITTRTDTLYVMAERRDGFRFYEGKIALKYGNPAYRYVKLTLPTRPRTIRLC